MALIHKDPDVRRKELVDAAERLFNERGYENTSVSSIIEAVGIAKGTFYYYFKSKENIFDAVLDSFWEVFWNDTAEILSSEGDAADKIQRFLISALEFRIKRKYSIDLFLDNEHILIMDGLVREGISKLSPVLTTIIKQGVSEGIFDTRYPEETVEYLLLNGIYVNLYPELFEDPDSLLAELDFYRWTAARLLGASEVTMKRITGDIF